MTMVRRRFQFGQHFRMVLSQRFTGERGLIANLNRSLRIVVCHPLVFHPHTRYTVTRSRHQIRIIETQILRSRRNKAIPVLCTSLVTQSQMPLSDSSRRITRRLKYIGHSGLLRTNHHTRITSRDTRIISPPTIMSRKKRIAGRRTGRSYRMRICKAQTFSRQSIHIRRLNTFRTITTQISVTQIIGYNENHIRLFYFFLLLTAASREQGSTDSQAH